MADAPGTTVLVKLPSGLRLASALLTEESPPRHVYRVLGTDGTVLSEHRTLVELIDRLDDRDVDVRAESA